MRPKRSVKVRQFRHLPKSLFENYVMAPCYEWDYEGLHCVLWHNIMMGVVDFEGMEYAFRVIEVNLGRIRFNLDTEGFDLDLSAELRIKLAHALAYFFGYMNIQSFNFKVFYEKVI